jgi:hypothetical protein
MTDNVVVLGGITTLPIPVERILDAPEARALESIVLVGLNEDGELYLAFSDSDVPQILWLFERAKNMLMQQYDK